MCKLAIYKFRVRPGYGSKTLLIEFRGDHRSEEFPNVHVILAKGLCAKPKEHPTPDTSSIGLATDEFISMWQYENGEYELDDDIGGFFIRAPENNSQVLEDIERVLLKSGRFAKEVVDFSEYT